MKLTKGVHSILRTSHVRIIFRHQHYRFAQSTYRYDESFLSTHLCEFGK